MTPSRMTVTKVALVGAGVGVVAALIFGILELKAESDYEKETPAARASDDIAKKGRTLRAADQRRHRAGGGRAGGAGIAGYPLVLRLEREAEDDGVPVHAHGHARTGGGASFSAAGAAAVRVPARRVLLPQLRRCR